MASCSTHMRRNPHKPDYPVVDAGVYARVPYPRWPTLIVVFSAIRGRLALRG